MSREVVEGAGRDGVGDHLGAATCGGQRDFGRPSATRSEIEAAARAVGADQVIAALPHSYDTEVGERGALLSAGERQLIGFARAWTADPAVLLPDEATSNLDVVTETRVQQALQRLRHGRTTIVIAHRLSTVLEADQVAVIEDGRVVEAGPPDELLAADGRFAGLYGRWLAGAARAQPGRASRNGSTEDVVDLHRRRAIAWAWRPRNSSTFAAP